MNVHNIHGFDRSGLAEAIAALYAAGEPAAELRKGVIALFRSALEQGHTVARETLEARRGGLACARYLSHVEDELIRAIHAYVVTYVHPATDSATEKRLVIAAVGGYGRGTLAPGSDIDLLFLLPPEEFKWGERVVEAILYVLWDLRQKVGHSTRSIEDCLTLAREDMTIRTALFEARFILGDEVTVRGYADALRKGNRQRDGDRIRRGQACRTGSASDAIWPHRVISSSPMSKRARAGCATSIRCFGSPNMSIASARPPNSSRRAFLRRRNTDSSPMRGIPLARALPSAFRNRPRGGRLSFDLQPVMAGRLGYVSRGGLAGVERFMKHYFLVAKDVGDLTTIVCAALEESQAKPAAVLDRFAAHARPHEKRVDSAGLCHRKRPRHA